MSKRNKNTGKPVIRGASPTKERQTQNGGVEIDPIYINNDGVIFTRRYRARFEAVIDAYLWNNTLTKPQYDAAVGFKCAYMRYVLGIKLEDGSGAFSDPEMRTISAINGSRLLKEAFEVMTPLQRDILIAVSVENRRAGTTRRIKYLQKALTNLAIKWNLLDG